MNQNFTSEYLSEILSNDKNISLMYDYKEGEAYFEPLWDDVEPPNANSQLTQISRLCGYTNEQHFINEEIAELKAIAKNSYSDFKTYQNEFLEVKKIYKKSFLKDLVNRYETIFKRRIFANEDLKELTQTLVLTPLVFIFKTHFDQSYFMQNGEKLKFIKKGNKQIIKDFDKDAGFEVGYTNEEEILEISSLAIELLVKKIQIDLASIRWDLAFYVNSDSFYRHKPLKSYFRSENNRNSRSKRGRKKRIRQEEEIEFREIAESVINNEKIGTQEELYLELSQKWTKEFREIEESTIRKNYSDLLSDLLDKLD